MSILKNAKTDSGKSAQSVKVTICNPDHSGNPQYSQSVLSICFPIAQSTFHKEGRGE